MKFVLLQVAVVANNRSMKKLPKVEGLLSYRSDDRKLYLNENSNWEALATQKDVSYIPYNHNKIKIVRSQEYR